MGRILRAEAGAGDGGAEQGYQVLFRLVLTHKLLKKKSFSCSRYELCTVQGVECVLYKCAMCIVQGMHIALYKVYSVYDRGCAVCILYLKKKLSVIKRTLK